MSWTIEALNPQDSSTEDISSVVTSITANQTLDNEADTFKITCNNISKPYMFWNCTIKKDSIKRISGFVLNQSDNEVSGQLSFKRSNLDCIDWSYIFNNRVVNERLANQSASSMIKYLISKYAAEITVANIKESGSIITEMYFPFVTLKEAINKIVETLYNWYWYVDANKDMHLFKDYEADGIEIKANNNKWDIVKETLKVSYKGEEVANRVWIVGSKQASTAYVYKYFTGDGTQRIFDFGYEPNYVEIYVNNVLKDSSLESNDNGSRDFLINKTDRLFRIPDNIATPFTGTIKAKFRPTVQIVDYFEKPINTAGNLRIEKVVKNKDITDRLSARKFGKAEINRTSTLRRVLNFSTRKDISIGQRIPVSIISGLWNITGYFLVTSVSTTISPADEIKAVELEEIL